MLSITVLVSTVVDFLSANTTQSFHMGQLRLYNDFKGSQKYGKTRTESYETNRLGP